MGFMRDDHYSFNEMTYNIANGRWYLVMAGSRRLRSLVGKLGCVRSVSAMYNSDVLWLEPEFTHSYSARLNVMEYIEGMIDVVLNSAYPLARCFSDFIESIDFSADDDEGYDYVDWDDGSWEGYDRSDDDDYFPPM